MTRKHHLKSFLPPLLLILFGILAYWNSFDGVFLGDDRASILDNPHIRVLWPLRRAMSLPLSNTGLTVDGRPLLSLTFALNHRFLGPDPWGYHLVNLVIHIVAGLLLFGVVRRTLALPRFWERYGHSSRWLALAAALIWLVHPLQTESVTYIVQRAESLMGMLFLLTLYASLRGFEAMRNEECGMGNGDRLTAELRTHPGRVSSAPVRASRRASARPWHLAAILACAIGMGVKQTMFSAPLLVLLYDTTFISSSLRAALAKRKWFYAALFSTWLIVFGIIGLTWKESTSDFVTINPVRYLLTQPLVLLHYLRLAVWPSPLVVSYGWQLEDQWSRIVFPALAILGMLVAMFHGLWRRRWYGFVAAWFFLILAPTSSIAPMRQAAFEHRMYLSLAAVVVLAVIGGEYAIRRVCASPKQGALLGGCLAAAIVLLFGYLTHSRNRDYHSLVGMWEDNLVHRPRSYLARLSLGNALQALGRPREAIEQHVQALRIRPASAAAHLNLGNALLDLGRPGDAIPHYREAIRSRPSLASAHYNLGNALQALGQLREAIPHYEQALRIRPGHANAHNNAGNALLALGRPREALDHYRQALRIVPDDADTHSNLGSALLTLGQPGAAIPHFRESLRLGPGRAEVHFNWGLALEATGQPRDALAQYREAVRLRPDLAAAQKKLREMREKLRESSLDGV